MIDVHTEKGAGSIRKPFENFVADHTPWLLRVVKGKLRNQSLAEDIVQEIMIKAFRAYDAYSDQGRERAWLMRIARNTLCDYFSKSTVETISFEALTESGEKPFDLIQEASLEETCQQNALICEILSAVRKMSRVDQAVFNCRYLMDFSIAETARRLNLPLGSVKSKSHSILKKLQREFEPDERKISMNCETAQKLLFYYAKGILKEQQSELREHLKTCSKCADIAEALKLLIPHIPMSKDDISAHFLITVPDQEGVDIDYYGSGRPLTEEAAKQLSGRSRELKKRVENGELQYDQRQSFRFDNDGNKFYLINIAPEGFYYESVKKFYAPTDFAFGSSKRSMFCKTERDYLRPREGCPGVFECRLENNFGPAVYSSLYMAVPKQAKKISIIRGNGMIDCGPYTFAYVSRYVAEGERIVLEFTYEV